MAGKILMNEGLSWLMDTTLSLKIFSGGELYELSETATCQFKLR